MIEGIFSLLWWLIKLPFLVLKGLLEILLFPVQALFVASGGVLMDWIGSLACNKISLKPASRWNTRLLRTPGYTGVGGCGPCCGGSE